MAKAKTAKKAKEVSEVSKTSKKGKKSYTITKTNGNVIHRNMMGDLSLKNYKAKGWKVEEV